MEQDGLSLQDVLRRSRARIAEFDRIAARRSGDSALGEDPDPVIPTPRGQAPSEREIDVLRLVAEGLSNKQIAERLFVAEDTVKSHVRNLLIKLAAQNRAHAVMLGYAQGLLGPPSSRAA